MEFITLKELAVEFQVDRSTLRKWIVKNKFESCRVRTPDSLGQKSLAFTSSEAKLIRETRRLEGFNTIKTEQVYMKPNIGVFYTIQLIPDVLPIRIKLGFTTNINERLSNHRTAAPTATLFETWACRRIWELPAIDSITRTKCKSISGEVFDFESLEDVKQAGNMFFSLLPKL